MSTASYLTARPSHDLIRAAHQQVTRDWWETRSSFELFISQFVLDEAKEGDSEAAGRRLFALRKIEAICRATGFEPPVICTPVELVKEF